MERVEIPSDAVYCEWERTKDLVAASEQSRSGDGIASAGATSGESIKRKNGGNFGFRNASFVPKPDLRINTLFKDDE